MSMHEADPLQEATDRIHMSHVDTHEQFTNYTYRREGVAKDIQMSQCMKLAHFRRQLSELVVVDIKEH
jgi:hypothetical protein